jgi:hypothetical protein
MLQGACPRKNTQAFASLALGAVLGVAGQRRIYAGPRSLP